MQKELKTAISNKLIKYELVMDSHLILLLRTRFLEVFDLRLYGDGLESNSQKPLQKHQGQNHCLSFEEIDRKGTRLTPP